LAQSSCYRKLQFLNATQAAIRAGYSKKTASRIALELLHKTHVSDRVTALQQKRADAMGYENLRLRQELQPSSKNALRITIKSMSTGDSLRGGLVLSQ